MWRVFPIEWLVSYFVFATGLVFAAIWLVQGKPHFWKQHSKLQGARAFLSMLSSTASIVILMTVVSGKFLWSPITHLPWFAEEIYPNINGVWEGIVESNWIDPATGRRIRPVPVKVTIHQDFFSVDVRLMSGNAYTESKTVAAWPERDEKRTSPRLWYTFEAWTKNPQPDDAPVHQGSAVVDVVRSGDDIVLDGVYWTNRNWHKNKNTAGHIHFERMQTGSPPRSTRPQ
jgi:hypothetical protein